MRIPIIYFVAASCFAGSPIQIWSSADLKTATEQLAGSSDGRTIAGKTLGAFGNHSASLWRRAKSGEAELHRTKVDLLIIEQGSASLLTGGTIADAHTTQPNEIRGSSIRNGELRKLAPGDIVRIAPGTPHQFLLAPGETVAYFALKIESKKE